jgi:hypothetical protein
MGKRRSTADGFCHEIKDSDYRLSFNFVTALFSLAKTRLKFHTGSDAELNTATLAFQVWEFPFYHIPASADDYSRPVS